MTTTSEENTIPCSVVVGSVCLAVAVFSVFLFSAVYVPPQPRTDLQWWQTAVIYQIYPRSFYDSDGDGIGDIKGITYKLDYFQDIGVEAIWLSPVYSSPQVDFGYDVTDYVDIDPIFGDLQDMMEMIQQAHSRGMKVIFDFIPNHTSDQHIWFQKSRRQETENGVSYKDFYIWNSGKQSNTGDDTIQGNLSTSTDSNASNRPHPPNNWLSVFGGSAWQWDDQRQEYYFHQFSVHQPDLNYRNPEVTKKMIDVLRFWVERGVDGFRVDAPDFLLENSDLNLDEPLKSHTQNSRTEQIDFFALDHIYTQHQPETHEIFKRWRDFLDEHEHRTEKHIFLIAESFDNTTSLEWWKSFYQNGAADMPFNFYLMERTYESCGGQCFRDVVETLIKALPKGKSLCWVTGSHDQSRVATKYGCEYVNVLNMLNLLLPGTAITYQGEEIGLEDITLTFDQIKDPIGKHAGYYYFRTASRDGCRSPMQWSTEQNGGFTSGETPWLPLHPTYAMNNVQLQLSDLSSTLWQYKRLVELRRRPAFRWGDLEFSLSTEQIFSFVRFAPGNMHRKYLVIVNMGKIPASNDYAATTSQESPIPESGRVAFVATDGSCPAKDQSRSDSSRFNSSSKSNYVIGQEISLKAVFLEPGNGLVIEF